jgi:hypothetical protein
MPDYKVSVVLPRNTLNMWVDAVVESAAAQNYHCYEVTVVRGGIDPYPDCTWTCRPLGVRFMTNHPSVAESGALAHCIDNNGARGGRGGPLAAPRWHACTCRQARSRP